MRPTDWAFVNYTDMDSMHDTSTYTQIRKHAMKQVGAAKRKPRVQHNPIIELFWVPTEHKCPALVDNHQKVEAGIRTHQKAQAVNRRVTEDKMLYDSFIHSISSRFDPFDSMSIVLDSTAQGLVQYFIFHASRAPNTWTYSSSALLPSGPRERQESVHRTVGVALQDPLLGNCLLATATARLCYCCHTERVDGRHGSLSQLQRRDLALTSAALRLLRDRLDEGQEEQQNQKAVEMLVTSMVHLGGAAFYRSDVATANTHIRAAITLTKRIGGLKGIRDPYVRGRIISFDDLLSCVEVSACLLTDQYDRQPRHDAGYSKDDFDGPLDAWNFPAMSPSLRKLILEVIEFQEERDLRFAVSSKSTSDRLATQQWATLQVLALRNELLGAKLVALRANVLRVAVLMWTLLPPHPSLMGTANILPRLVPKFRYLLLEATDLQCDDCKDIRLWCLIMGYCCAPEGSHLSDWFAEEVVRQLDRYGTGDVSFAQSYDGLVAFQKQFLWYEAAQGPAIQRLALWLLENRSP